MASSQSVLKGFSNLGRARNDQAEPPLNRAAARMMAAAAGLLHQPSLRSPKMRVGLGIVGFFLLRALVRPLLVHQDTTTVSTDPLEGPSAAHGIGRTQNGEDAFAQVRRSGRATLPVGCAT